MTVHTRDLFEIALTKESTRKTAEAPSSGDWIELLEGSAKEIFTKKENMSRNGTLVNAHSDRLVMKDYEFNIKAIMDVINFPKLLMGLLGDVNTTADSPETGVNTHVLTRLDSNLLPLYTMSTQDPTDGDLSYAGASPNKLAFSYVKDDFVQYTSDGRMLSRTSPTFSSGYNATNSEFLPWQVSIKKASNYAGLGAADEIEVGSVDLNFGRANRAYHGIGIQALEATEMIAQKLVLGGKFTCLFDDTTYKTWAQTDADYEALSIKITDTSRTIGSSTNPSIEIAYPAVSTRNWSKEEKDDYTDQSFDILPTGNDKTNGDVIVTVVNDVASY